MGFVRRGSMADVVFSTGDRNAQRWTVVKHDLYPTALNHGCKTDYASSYSTAMVSKSFRWTAWKHAAVEDLLRTRAREFGVVGASLAVVRGDDTEVATAGTADLTRPVVAGTPFQIASVTKPMVATVIAELAERGLLGFDDPAEAHIPELRGATWARDVTLRHLLACTSGLPLSARSEFLFESDGEDALSRYAADLATGVPIARPGRIWSYSNASWCLLGRAIETATGLEFESAMRSELFGPLGLSATSFRSYDPSTHAHHFLTGNREPVATAPWTARALGPAGGSVWSTAADLAQFARAHFDGYGELRETQADVGVPHFADRWCLGWARFDWEGGPIWGWDGIGGGHRAILRVAPQQRLAIALLTNSSTGRLLYRALFTELLADVGVTVPSISLAPVAEPDLEQYVGTYAWPDRSIQVGMTGGSLAYDDGGPQRALTPVGNRNFLIEGAPAEAPLLRFAPGGVALYDLVWAYPRTGTSTARSPG